MSLEAKMDELIVSLNKNTEALLANKAAGGAAAATTDKPAKTTKAKDGPTSAHTGAEVKERFNTLKADKANLPKLKKLIADLGASSLDELAGKVELLDKAWTALDELEASIAAPADADDDL